MRVQTSTVPYHSVDFPPRSFSLQKRKDGALLLASSVPSLSHNERFIDLFNATVANVPSQIALAQRTADDSWQTITYADLKRQADSAAQWFLEHGADAQTPIMVNSHNSIEHAIIRHAALTIGAPYVPVSEGYALLGAADDYQRLRFVLGLIKPGFIFAQSEHAQEAVLACAPTAQLICADSAIDASFIPLANVINTPVTDELARATERLTADDVTAYMLTSGSTGNPKAVLHTNRMMCQAVAQQKWMMEGTGLWQHGVLEWLPWSHVSGLYVTLSVGVLGYTIWIDNGKPLPGMFEQSIRNIAELRPSYLTNIPAGFALLTQAFSQSTELGRRFFEKCRVLLFGGASLAAPVYTALQEMAIQYTKKRVLIASGYGSTETTTGCFAAYYPTENPGIGLPLPGTVSKLVPHSTGYELRIKGPMVTPGYLNQPDATHDMFDDEGYYCTGDIVDFIDDSEPSAGLKFNGRIAEEFKLSSGTWVGSGLIRTRLLERLAPYVVDVLICGENRDNVGVLAIPKGSIGESQWVEIRAHIEEYNSLHRGVSEFIKHFAISAIPVVLGSSEVSDKGSINQKVALKRRAEEVEQLYNVEPTFHYLRFD